MANRRSEETAEQGAARRERHQQRIADSRSEETTDLCDAQSARDQELATSRPASERIVSLEVELGGFGDQSVVSSRTWKNLRCSCDHAHDLDLGKMT